MTSAFPLHRYTYQDYVSLEAESTTRHEFLAGEIVAMAGGTPEHAAMAAEVIGQLRDQIRGGSCRVFTSDLGVRVMATGLATYPDASVVCGPTERDPEKRTSVTNPRIIVEVTSDSTEDYDRGEKLTHYKQVPSLEAIVVVSHRAAQIEVWSRPNSSSLWTRTSAGAGEIAELSALSCRLDVDAVWRAAAEPA
ncbi:MAG: Uma2 family endonuclease [Myxococcales bacterium]|nr:MAG: Uma2 family endonuclease [Myxococcales bacterium]